MTTGATILARSDAARAFFAVSFIGTLAITYSIIWFRAHPFGPATRIFSRLFLFEDHVAAWVLLGIVLAGLTPSLQRWGMQAVDVLGRHPIRAASITAIMLAIAAKFGYLAHPLSMDEYAAVFQSKIFAAGHIAGHFPPAQMNWLVPRTFQNVFLIVSPGTGSVASGYWPGFALVLTPFTLIGAPWLCNPVLGGLTVLSLHRLALDLFSDRRAAGFAVLFTIASVAVTINAISFYSMSAHLLFNAAFAICLLRKRVGYAFLAGLIGGMALVLHNPLPHALFAAPWFVWLLFQKDRLRLTGALFAGYLPVVLLLGFGWAQYLRALKTEPVAGAAAAAIDASLQTAVHGIWRSAQSVLSPPSVSVIKIRLIGLAKVWLWASPGLLALAVYGVWKGRNDRRVLLFAASALLTLVGYTFYPADQGHGWGFRYFHSAWLALPLLAVAALFNQDPKRPEADTKDLRGLAAGSALAALVAMSGLRVYQVHEFVSAHLTQLPKADRGEPVIQIVSPGTGYYAEDLVQNDPFLRNPVTRMITNGRKADEEMMRSYFPQLVLLSRSDRGSLWGRRSSESAISADIPVGSHQQRQ